MCPLSPNILVIDRQDNDWRWPDLLLVWVASFGVLVAVGLLSVFIYRYAGLGRYG